MSTVLEPLLQSLHAFADCDHFLEQQGRLFPYEPQSLDEVVWPSGNPAGIPDLDPAMMATEIPEPFTIWGDLPRRDEMPGSYGFYCDDYKFNGLWRDPEKLVRSCCQVAIEPNFSVRPRMPLPVALYEIFRKRWLSRYWQSQGVKIIVDMNVAGKYVGLNMLGVPKGCTAYVTRAHKGEHDLLEHVYRLCQHHADTEDILFLVYGGGTTIEAICSRNGWQWRPEKMHTQRRRRYANERALVQEKLFSLS